MEQLITAINNLTASVTILCIIQFLFLLMKDTSGSYRLRKIEEAIQELIHTIKFKK